MKTFNISAKTALVFFTMGTFLFFLQIYMGKLTALTVIGFYYLIIAIIINCIFLITLIVKLILDQHRAETVRSIGIILANIPIATAYIFILFEFKMV